MQPSEVGSSSSSFGVYSDLFTNIGNVVQSVGSVYDQITGKSQSVPGQVYSQSPTPVPVPVPVPVKTSALNSGSTLAIGAVVLIGALLLIRD